MHTDRDIYFLGDIVWYKAYVLRDGLLDHSVRNLYFDWADESGKIIKSSVVLVADGVGIGDFDLPIESKANYLQLNVYTAPLVNNRELAYYRSLAVAQSSYISDKNASAASIDQVPNRINKIVQINQNNPDILEIVLIGIDSKEVVIKARINNDNLFEQNLMLESGKKLKIPIPKKDIRSGVFQLRVYDKNSNEIERATELIGLESLLLEPKVSVSNQNLSIQLLPEEIATLSFSVIQEVLPFDTVQTIWNDMVLKNNAVGNYPRTIHTSKENLNRGEWRWEDVPEKLTAVKEEGMLSLKATIEMKPSDKKKYDKKRADILSSGSLMRGVSVSSQAANEDDPMYKVFPLNDNFEIEMPNMTFFGDLYLKTRMADPELDKIKFTTAYKFKEINTPKLIYKPVWEDFSVTKGLKKEWLPIYKDYSSYLANLIDTVTVKGQRNLNLVRKYDPMNQYLNDDSEIIAVQEDARVRKYSVTFADYLPTMNTRRGAIGNSPQRLLYFINSRQATYDEVSRLFMNTIAYVRVYHNLSAIGGLINDKNYSSHIAGIQLVEIPPDELRKFHTIDEKIEGYIEPKTFDQIGKMTLWWNPFFIVDSETGNTTIKLPVELKGKRINIQGVTNSGKLVYYNQIVN